MHWALTHLDYVSEVGNIGGGNLGKLGGCMLL